MERRNKASVEESQGVSSGGIEEVAIEYVDIDRLKPYDRNAKKHPPEQVEAIAQSINRFGYNQIVTIDENDVILAGHGRREALRKLGKKQVPCIRRTGLSDAEKRAYRLADNRTGESDWDWDVVSVELEELFDEGFDLDVTGFNEEEIRGALFGGESYDEFESTAGQSAEPEEQVKINATIPQRLYDEGFKQLVQKLVDHPECNISVEGAIE